MYMYLIMSYVIDELFFIYLFIYVHVFNYVIM